MVFSYLKGIFERIPNLFRYSGLMTEKTTNSVFFLHYMCGLPNLELSFRIKYHREPMLISYMRGLEKSSFILR